MEIFPSCSGIVSRDLNSKRDPRQCTGMFTNVTFIVFLLTYKKAVTSMVMSRAQLYIIRVN